MSRSLPNDLHLKFNRMAVIPLQLKREAMPSEEAQSAPEAQSQILISHMSACGHVVILTYGRAGIPSRQLAGVTT